MSYGGVSGGLRSAQLAKQLVTTLKMMPMMEGVMVQMPWNLLDENKAFQASEHHENSGKAMLDELEKVGQPIPSQAKLANGFPTAGTYGGLDFNPLC